MTKDPLSRPEHGAGPSPAIPAPRPSPNHQQRGIMRFGEEKYPLTCHNIEVVIGSTRFRFKPLTVAWTVFEVYRDGAPSWPPEIVTAEERDRMMGLAAAQAGIGTPIRH